MPLQHFLNSQFKVGVGLKLWVFSASFFHSVHLINLHWIGFKCFHQGVEMQYKRNSLWLFLSYFSTTLNRLSLLCKMWDWLEAHCHMSKKKKHQKIESVVGSSISSLSILLALQKGVVSLWTGRPADLSAASSRSLSWEKINLSLPITASVTSATAFWTAEKVSAVTDVFVCGAADHTVVLLKSLSIVITTVIWFHVVHRRSSYQHPIRRLRVI